MFSKILTKPVAISAVIILALAIVFVLALRRHTQVDCQSIVRFIPIVGDITNMQGKDLNATGTPEADEDTILSKLQSANNDTSVKAVVLLIDSNGGDPETAEEITNEMHHMNKPIYALIRGNGDSAAYWIASETNKIFAFKTSDVGSIGVTDSYVSDVGQNEQSGQQFISLASGQFKDVGSPDKPLTQADRNYLMKGVMDEYNIFVSAVAQNRHLPLENVKALADGSSVLGDVAVQDGLIDSTGGWDALWQEINKDLSTKCYFIK